MFKSYRAKKYDKLNWVNDDKYIQDILNFTAPKKDDMMLDVGTGTGIIGDAFVPHVSQVIGVDNSKEMLIKASGRFPVILWDFKNPLFYDNVFDIIIARMSLHHMEKPNDAIDMCYNYLKNNGKLVIAEGVPPKDDSNIVYWFTKMFKLKEKRHVFSTSGLFFSLKKAGFKNIDYQYNIIENFSIGNWLSNSGLPESICKKIFDMHKNAPKMIKEAFNMRISDDDILIKSTNIIIKGHKRV